MKHNYFFHNTDIDLQLFAEGGDTGGAEATGGNATVAASKGGNDLSNVQYGIGEGEQVASVQNESNPQQTVDREAEFEKLIKGDFKEQYDKRVQSTIQSRLRGTKATVARDAAFAPVRDMLAQKYGVKADDAEAMLRALEADDAFISAEAERMGVDNETARRVMRMERENAALRRQMEESARLEAINKQLRQWHGEAEQVKQVYPSFDLEAELANDEFTALLKNNVSMRTAYEVIHNGEIMPAAMQFTAQRVEEKLTKKIASGNRVAENGMGSQSRAVHKSKVSQLSDADINEVIRRVQRGEKIRF